MIIKRFSITHKYLLTKLFFLIVICTLFFPLSIVFADEKGTSGNADFDFDATIKTADIKDGTYPFDLKDETGYDSSDHNGIVRTFDSITYPLKVTINPKKSDSLKNIKLKITGELENGVKNSRVNAVFSVDNKTDLEKDKVSFEQYYTVQETGNSVMIPIVVETKGAIDGTKIKPSIKVQVVEVDGNAIKEDVSVSFNDLPKTIITGKVNVKSAIYGAYSSERLEQVVNPTLDKSDLSRLHFRNVSFYIAPLQEQNSDKGKTTMVGSTFPDGKINFHFEFSGEVSWTSGEKEKFDFEKKNKKIELFSMYPIVNTPTFRGMENTISEKLNVYSNVPWSGNGTSRSKFTDFSQNTIEREKTYSVWDSGDWKVSKPHIQGDKVIVNGENSNYVLGSTYPIYRTDGTKNRSFNENEFAFSTQGIIVKSPNEYLPLYGLNQQNKENNVYYTMKIVVDSYEDSKGKSHSLNISTSNTIVERNVPSGNYSMQNAFFTINGKELGTPNVGWSWVSKGDATLIKGQDVAFNTLTYGNSFALGGCVNLVKWNTDSFELTKNYAEWTYRDYKNHSYRPMDGLWYANPEKISVRFGVAKKDSTSFKAVTENEIDDYNWYDSYEEAKSHGDIGAMIRDIHDSLGLDVFMMHTTYLKVKTTQIGSENENGTPNIASQQSWVYPSKDRAKAYKVRENHFKDYTHYDSLGNLIKLQDPVGSTVNFETLGIINAEFSSSVESDKTTYYATDKINWTVKTGINIPSSVDLSDGQKVEIIQKIPKGLIYDLGSAKIGNDSVEPKIVENSDGTVDLIFTYFLSSKNRTIPNITYTTSIDPFVLGNGTQVSLSVKSIASCPELDSRREFFRTGSKQISVIKIGMVGVSAQMDEPTGKKNSDYSMTIKPYTTIDDEHGVKGISVLPYNGDNNGSKFSGTTWLKKIKVDSTKKLRFFINKNVVSEKNPNNVDVTANGWTEVSPNSTEEELSEAKTVYFIIDDVLSKDDSVSIKYVMGTKGNKFNDVYLNKTILNSDSEYKLSPESNKIQYRITADIELRFQSIRIYTGKSTVGLNGSLNISKEILNDKSKDKEVDLVVYNKDTNRAVYRKKYKISELPEKVDFHIPSDGLRKNDHKNYEAVFENYDQELINIVDGAEKIDTDGYTSSELSLKATNQAISYKGVVMTQRIIGKNMELLYETLDVSALNNERTKSGYGIDFKDKLKVKYTNELKKDSKINTALLVNDSLAEKTLKLKSNKGYSELPLLNDETKVSESSTDYQFSYKLPEVVVQVGNGDVYMKTEKERLSAKNINTVDGGNKLYVPIWINKLGNYDFMFTSTNEVGINAVTFTSKASVNVYAYMYATIDSETAKEDELLLEPVYPESTTPKGWLKKELDWLNQ